MVSKWVISPIYLIYKKVTTHLLYKHLLTSSDIQVPMLANCQGVVLKPTPLPVSASTTHVFLGDMTKEAPFLDHFHAMKTQQKADVTRNLASHLAYLRPCKKWDQLPVNWCRISSINSIINEKGCCMVLNGYIFDSLSESAKVVVLSRFVIWARSRHSAISTTALSIIVAYLCHLVESFHQHKQTHHSALYFYRPIYEKNQAIIAETVS